MTENNNPFGVYTIVLLCEITLQKTNGMNRIGNNMRKRIGTLTSPTASIREDHRIESCSS
ncbi:hypothetical protein SDC9_134474 [bioreactor metagenome]|uniref:Uncharacterized protein n=1 Tax=bioreactor metagenome TaxID=1076179 RepID=A0A645DEB0_9ZZZZ